MVHYDAARSAEVFIHRAGRTARARAAGLSLSIVAPRDDANHRQTCSVLGLHDGMQAFPLDMRMVERARERVGMALRVRGRERGMGQREKERRGLSPATAAAAQHQQNLVRCFVKVRIFEFSALPKSTETKLRVRPWKKWLLLGIM